ncbi:phosphoribosylaminoimidazole-succinocarboxamide synthase [Luminiphilus syltensis NOR5-1B]|uniref:phosphoribosylaminoimidazolesuccinocarboxamide synthase n=1 Tax=Luminiphilus syltensis NOR5-1B TaxID=565045 RepID=B8KRI2_9GAMM|nr:phosphoribosylaminoimidazolesuccinocarboxamide synthase [Luminiphilus syltensis]EED35172.1 phosphoribosylaminoimidazole-succinocarboxamide synthase [Luminiphilus syltensis NOR5-1B]
MANIPTILEISDDFPIATSSPVHSGKVRSAYWLTSNDSRRLVEARGYPASADSQLGILIISDRISAFECLWHGEGDLRGVPGKGAALNAISAHWFDRFRTEGLARSHILEVPHPLVWVVQRAQPIQIEAIARRYITGSMWRAYHAGARDFCGYTLPPGLRAHERLEELVVTPSTKGIIRGIPGVPEADDVNVSRSILRAHWRAFDFRASATSIATSSCYAPALTLSAAISPGQGRIFVDTKFEFGYVHSESGTLEMIYMDEVGTPDSSRIWEGDAYRQGQVVERSKEAFRQALLDLAPDPAVLLDKQRMAERLAFAATTTLPLELMMDVSQNYLGLGREITGSEIRVPEHPRAEILDALAGLGLI